MSLPLAISLVVLLAALAYAGLRLRHPPPVWDPKPRAKEGGAPRGVPGGGGWEANLRAGLREIPKGRVVTFTELAARVGLDGSILTVSRQVRGYQEDKKTPWWRAVRKEGGRGIVPSSELGKKQQALLEKEGVIFQQGGFRLADYEWKP